MARFFVDNVLHVRYDLGTITFEEGEHEASVEIVLCREMAQRESSFDIELMDPHDRVYLVVPRTSVTVIRDKGG